MIHQFNFSNFYSFLDEQCLDFKVPAHAPDTNAYVESATSDRLGKVLVAFGANGSGKTNLIRALAFYKWFVAYSFKLDLEDEIPFEPHSLKPKTPTQFKVRFELFDTIYEHAVSLTRSKVLSEELSVREPDRRRFNFVFRRKWSPEDKRYNVRYNDDVKIGEGKLTTTYEAPYKRQNASMISIGAQASDEFYETLWAYWSIGHSNVRESGRKRDRVWDQLVKTSTDLFEDHDRFDSVRAFLRQCDLGLSDVSIKQFESVTDKGETREVLFPIGLHTVGNRQFSLPFIYESEGTQNLYLHTAEIMSVLSLGGQCFLDELDADIHPLLVPKLLELFSDIRMNPRSAQIVCTCHSVPVMNYLDKYQIVLVEKDRRARSSLYRLDELEGVRSDENYFAKYLAGAYGAVPEL